MSYYHRIAQSQLVTVGLAVLMAGIVSIAFAQPTTITIQAGQPGKSISPDLFGVFFEDLNYVADGGLYAELIQNRSFEYSPTEQGDWHPLKWGRGDNSKAAPLAASAVRDSKSDVLIVKIVNGERAVVTLKVELAGLASGAKRASRTVLTGADAEAYNQDDQPPAVKPIEAPANSLAVFRVNN